MATTPSLPVPNVLPWDVPSWGSDPADKLSEDWFGKPVAQQNAQERAEWAQQAPAALAEIAQKVVALSQAAGVTPNQFNAGRAAIPSLPDFMQKALEVITFVAGAAGHFIVNFFAELLNGIGRANERYIIGLLVAAVVVFVLLTPPA